MKKEIKINEATNRAGEKVFKISFPKELKDNFKSVFKSARWNGYEKVWEVGPRSGKRAEQWRETVISTGIMEKMAAAEEADFDAAEAEKIVSELKSLVADYDRKIADAENAKREAQRLAEQMRDDKDKFKKMAAILVAAEDALAVAVAESEQAKAESAAEENKVADLFGKYVDVDAIESAIDDMINAMPNKWGKGGDRGEFDEAKSVIHTEREKLNRAGLDSWGLTDAAYANYNRPDRDTQALRRATENTRLFDLYRVEWNADTEEYDRVYE